MTKKSLREMKLHHCTVLINKQGYQLDVTRVLNGWIYTQWMKVDHNSGPSTTEVTSVFVPEQAIEDKKVMIDLSLLLPEYIAKRLTDEQVSSLVSYYALPRTTVDLLPPEASMILDDKP